MPVIFTKCLKFEKKNGEILIKLNEKNSFKIQWRDTWYNFGKFHYLISASFIPSNVIQIKLNCSDFENECVTLSNEEEIIFSTVFQTGILFVEYENKDDEIKDDLKIPEFRPLERMASILGQSLTTKELSDVIFRTNDGQEVYANRCILYSQSEILKALFNEKSETPTEIEVNFSKDIVFRAMQFCYGKNDIIEGFEGELINFADQYGIKELKGVCLKSLELRILSCENICAIVSLAFIHDHGILKEKCIEFLRKNKSKIGAEEISNLSNDILVSTILSF